MRAQSPSPALPPQNMPALSPAPTQRSVPEGQAPSTAPTTDIGPPQVSPLDPHIATPDAPTPQIDHAENSKVDPPREDASGLQPRFLGFLGPFRRPTIPPLFDGSAARMNGLIRDGKLYITLQDAIALALENNLDVEAERYNITLAKTDVTRAAGGGSLRGIDYNIALPQNGVGGPGSPLLNADTVNSNPTTPTVTDLTVAQLNHTDAAIVLRNGRRLHLRARPQCPPLRSPTHRRRRLPPPLRHRHARRHHRHRRHHRRRNNNAATRLHRRQPLLPRRLLQRPPTRSHRQQRLIGRVRIQRPARPLLHSQHLHHPRSTAPPRLRTQRKSALPAHRPRRPKDLAPPLRAASHGDHLRHLALVLRPRLARRKRLGESRIPPCRNQDA